MDNKEGGMVVRWSVVANDEGHNVWICIAQINEICALRKKLFELKYFECQEKNNQNYPANPQKCLKCGPEQGLSMPQISHPFRSDHCLPTMILQQFPLPPVLLLPNPVHPKFFQTTLSPDLLIFLAICQLCVKIILHYHLSIVLLQMIVCRRIKIQTSNEFYN